MARYSRDALRVLFRIRTIATLGELKTALGTDVDMTVFRKLAELSYRTSYSHGGRYYMLDRTARFNELGLWSHRAVWFSRHGTLLATLDALVSAAEAGYWAQELKACLHVEVKAALWRLVQDKRLAREKLSGVYLYCASDGPVRAQQLARRRAREDERLSGVDAGLAELTDEVRAAIILFFSVLEEQQRRLFAGLEALQFGASDRWIADLLGRRTIRPHPQPPRSGSWSAWRPRWRRRDHPGAAASLREGLEETLTLQTLGISGALWKTRRRTNPIENLNGGVAAFTRNVRRWRNGAMILRWRRSQRSSRQEQQFRRRCAGFARCCALSDALHQLVPTSRTRRKVATSLDRMGVQSFSVRSHQLQQRTGHPRTRTPPLSLLATCGGPAVLPPEAAAPLFAR